MKAIISSSGMTLADDVETADTLFARFKGLLGRRTLLPGHALWLRPCNGIHTFGMRFAIDVVVLDGSLAVRAIHHDVHPNRMTPLYPFGSSILELSSGSAQQANLAPGDIIALAP
jgi:uncharacterized membrane protein (UPF0127 family)